MSRVASDIEASFRGAGEFSYHKYNTKPSVCPCVLQDFSKEITLFLLRHMLLVAALFADPFGERRTFPAAEGVDYATG